MDAAQRNETHRRVVALWKESWDGPLHPEDEALFLRLQKTLTPTVTDGSILSFLGRLPNKHALAHDGLTIDDV